MGNEVFRKSALTPLGGFNESLQIKEDQEMVWRLEEAGYKAVIDLNIIVQHNESQDRFTLKGHLKRRFDYGYWWHMLFYLHPKKVMLGGWPWKTMTFLVLIPLFIWYPPLLLLVPLGLAYLLYHRKRNVSFCLKKFRTSTFRVLLLIILIESLSTLSFDLGNFYAMFDMMRGKMSKIG